MSRQYSQPNKLALKSVVSPLGSLAIVWNYSNPNWSHIVRRWYLVRDWSQPPLKKNECPRPPIFCMPPPITPEAILDAAPKKTRVLRLDANVIAYFGDLFHAWKVGMKRGIISGHLKGPATSGRTDPSNTASARNPS